MIEYKEHVLSNGLRVISHYNDRAPLANVVMLYCVGARHEQKGKTGLAHLCEHIMFCGSEHAPNFDKELQRAGGVNNAYTNQDTTLYYCSLPPRNIETAFWLESDRMGWLSMNEDSFTTQQNVVIEEFHQSYLNVPYGDLYHLLLHTVYDDSSPYHWPTIGQSPEEVKQLTLVDAQNFHRQYYAPNNAILCVGSALEAEKIWELSEKWFGDIPQQTLPTPPATTAVYGTNKYVEVERTIPQNALVKIYPMGGRTDPDYEVYDTITDLLALGESSRLKLRLVASQGLFNEVTAFVSGTHDSGLLMIQGFLHEDVSYEQAEKAINDELISLARTLEQDELNKVHNKYCASLLYGNLEMMNRTQTLATYAQLGDANRINMRITQRHAVTVERVRNILNKKLLADGGYTIRYRKKEDIKHA